MDIDIHKPQAKKYGIIYTDPAWPQKKGNTRACRPSQGKDLDYDTLSIPEIKKIHRRAVELCEDKKR